MERARKNPQLLLVLLATAFAVAAIWAATALAAGDSATASSNPGSSEPTADFVQAEDDAVPGEDCPEDGSGGSDGSERLVRIELHGLLVAAREPGGRLRSLRLPRGPLETGGADALGQCCDGGGELPAALAPRDVRSDVRHVGCGRLAVEHERQRPASPETGPAQRGQLIPCAGVRGVAVLLHRIRPSHERML